MKCQSLFSGKDKKNIICVNPESGKGYSDHLLIFKTQQAKCSFVFATDNIKPFKKTRIFRYH